MLLHQRPPTSIQTSASRRCCAFVAGAKTPLPRRTLAREDHRESDERSHFSGSRGLEVSNGYQYSLDTCTLAQASQLEGLSSHRRNAPNYPRDVRLAGHAAPACFAIDKLGDTLFQGQAGPDTLA